MEKQLTNNCEQHGLDCPDNVIQAGKFINSDEDKWFLVAGNADYNFRYCPACGKEIPKERQIQF